MGPTSTKKNYKDRLKYLERQMCYVSLATPIGIPKSLVPSLYCLLSTLVSTCVLHRVQSTFKTLIKCNTSF